MSSTSNRPAIPATLLSTLITQGIASVVCVGIPILVTLVAPVTTIELERGKGVSATVTRYTLLFVPWRKELIVHVSGVRADVTATRYKATTEERRRGDTGVKLSTGQIVLLDGEKETVVQAAPGLAESTAREMTEYLSRSGTEPLQKTVYASWSLTYVLGGVVTGLCAFYVVCVVLAVVTYPFKLLKSATVVRPDAGDHE